MLNFKENILQFIWLHKLISTTILQSVSGKTIEVLKFGDLNKDSGPDFLNARINIDGITLAGNIEIHLKTSDWLRHRHQNDSNYNTIILHLVYEHDKNIEQNLNHNVEVVELKDYVSLELITKYTKLIESKDNLPCIKLLPEVNEFIFSTWMQRLAIERLETKTTRLHNYFKEFNGDYLQSYYAMLLRTFGFNVNALPFELLAKHLPIQILLKHADNCLQLESLLLGVSGFLENYVDDAYCMQLQNEFEFLKNKYKLIPLNNKLFKRSKMRPANFPDLRLMQFAAFVNKHPNYLRAPYKILSFENLKEIFTNDVSAYWKTHYSIDAAEQTTKQLQLGTSSIEIIIINAVVPFLFYYGKQTQKEEIAEHAFELLGKCAYEKNNKTKLFASKYSKEFSAIEGQAQIELYDNYCTKRKCLQCAIGRNIIEKK